MWEKKDKKPPPTKTKWDGNILTVALDFRHPNVMPYSVQRGKKASVWTFYENGETRQKRTQSYNKTEALKFAFTKTLLTNVPDADKVLVVDWYRCNNIQQDHITNIKGGKSRSPILLAVPATLNSPTTHLSPLMSRLVDIPPPPSPTFMTHHTHQRKQLV